MGTATLISVDEYLHTSYRPDCDYVDGEVQERNLGTKPHGLLQSLFSQWFNERFDQFGCTATVDQRVRVAPDRVRIPDVCVVLDDNQDEFVIETAPLLCIEILSPEDRLPRLQDRIDDYTRMGVPNIWVADPITHAFWNVKDGALKPVPSNGSLPVEGTELVIDLATLFDDLERRLHRQRRHPTGSPSVPPAN